MKRCFGPMVLTVFLPLAAAADVVVQKLPKPVEDLKAYAVEQAARQGSVAEAGGLAKLFTEPSASLLLPSFTVDTVNPSGTSTLYAFRNVGDTTEMTTEVYFDSAGTIIGTETNQVAPHEVVPINLRDIAALGTIAGPDGIANGFVVVTAESETAKLVGDYFVADPGNDFATGGRLLEIENPQCGLWGIRFLNGGAFSGGTLLRFFFLSPLGGSPGTGSPTLIANIYDESGTFIDSVGVWTGDRAVNITAQSLIAGLAAGSLELFIAGEGGFVSGELSAAGRYSVSLDGTCIEPLMTMP